MSRTARYEMPIWDELAAELNGEQCAECGDPRCDVPEHDERMTRTARMIRERTLRDLRKDLNDGRQTAEAVLRLAGELHDMSDAEVVAMQQRATGHGEAAS